MPRRGRGKCFELCQRGEFYAAQYHSRAGCPYSCRRERGLPAVMLLYSLRINETQFVTQEIAYGSIRLPVVAHFQLKQALTEERYNDLWWRVNRGNGLRIETK